MMRRLDIQDSDASIRPIVRLSVFQAITVAVAGVSRVPECILELTVDTG